MHYSYEKFLAELGAKLRQMRLERGWTYRDMIVQHGFHLAHWQSFEKGKGISVPSLLRMCEVFDVTLDSLISGIGLTAEPARAGTAPGKKAKRKPVRVATSSAKSDATARPSPAAPRPRSPRREP